MRLEAEKVDADGSKVIVHAYGAGGRGYELSWGIAEDVTELMMKEGLLQAESSL
jgi:D-amino-acid oxidase